MARAKTKKSATKRTGRQTTAKRTRAARGAVKAKAVVKKRPAAAAKRPAAKAADPNTKMRALAQHIIAVSLSDDDERILGLYADDIESSEAGQPPMVGLAALRGKFAGWRSMTTDTHFEPRRVCVDGNVIVIEWVGRVTLAASGRQAELREIAVHEIRNGKIAREAFYYNPAALA
jgi:ketosteroid isomerase-like protein